MILIQDDEYNINLYITGYEYPYDKSKHWYDNNWLNIIIELSKQNSANTISKINGPYLLTEELKKIHIILSKGEGNLILTEQYIEISLARLNRKSYELQVILYTDLFSEKKITIKQHHSKETLNEIKERIKEKLLSFPER